MIATWIENLPAWVITLSGMIFIFVFFLIWAMVGIRSIDKSNAEDLAALKAKQGHNS